MADEKDANAGAWTRVPTWDGSPQTWRGFRKEMSWWLAGLDIQSTKKYNLAARWLLRQSGVVRQRGEEFDPRDLEFQKEIKMPNAETGDDEVVVEEDPLSGINKLLTALEEMTGRSSLDKRGELRNVFYLELKRKSGERISEFATRYRGLVAELKAEGVTIHDGELGWWFKQKLGLDPLRTQLLETALAGAEDYPTIEREVLRLFKDLHAADPLYRRSGDADQKAPLLSRFLNQQSGASKASSYAPSMTSSAARSLRSGSSTASSGRVTPSSTYRRPFQKQAMVSEVEEEIPATAEAGLDPQRWRRLGLDGVLEVQFPFQQLIRRRLKTKGNLFKKTVTTNHDHFVTESSMQAGRLRALLPEMMGSEASTSGNKMVNLPHLRYLPLPYPSTGTPDRWLQQGQKQVADGHGCKKHLDLAYTMDRFVYKNLTECGHWRDRMGAVTSFCEDPVVMGMIHGKTAKGLRDKMKNAAMEEALKEAKEAEAAGNKEEMARALIGPRGGLPSLRGDLLKLAALLNVEIKAEDNVETIKVKLRPMVNLLKEKPAPPQSKAKSKAKAAPSKAQGWTVGYSAGLVTEPSPGMVSYQHLIDMRNRFQTTLDSMALEIQELKNQQKEAGNVDLTSLGRSRSASSMSQDPVVDQSLREDAAQSLENAYEDHLMAYYGTSALHLLTREDRQRALDP
ncbi:Uncharacterized protein SCF082_LOCUS32201 [Durusdinium trenchii]|uniref:Uncharacterized protein n=1 Tax=Durusdinium trenchii TaxID=1381693 RepID=A0ABP0NDH3_9DINO